VSVLGAGGAGNEHERQDRPHSFDHPFSASPSYRLPATGFQLPASSYRLPASSFRLPASSFQLPASCSGHEATTITKTTKSLWSSCSLW